MKNRKKSAPAEARPFFARYLEGQEPDAEAKVEGGRSRSNFTYKEATEKSGEKSAKAVTMKYPSDNDEYVYYPYHPQAAEQQAKAPRHTLKYPSDSDEDGPYYALYQDEADVPKRATAKPKEAAVRLTRKKPKAG